MDSETRADPIATDPIAVELVLTLLSTAVTVVAFIYQLRRPAPQEYRRRLKDIRREILKLENSIDDVILMFDILTHKDPPELLSEKRLTLSETSFQLQARDFQRWLVIKDSVERVHRRLYDVFAELRELDLPEGEVEDSQHELVVMADQLVLSTSTLNVGDFVVQLRRLVQRLDDYVADLERE